MGATIVVGAQWGDEGKGLFSAYLSWKLGAKIVARAGTGANAEHGIFLKDEKTYLKVNQLPLGWMFNPKATIVIGSGVAVDPDKLLGEIIKYNLEGRVQVDYRCPIITPEHIRQEMEDKGMQSVGSTFSGTGRCRSDFVLRKAKQAKDIPALEPYLTDCGIYVNVACVKSDVIIESSQGTMLSLAVSPDYPNTTSDNVTACACADDVLLNWKRIEDVVLVVKAMPTREGKGSFGTSEEFTKDYLIENKMVEISSIGGVIRRKASGIDFEMLKYATQINGATQIALSFCEHYDPNIKNAKYYHQITKDIWDLIFKIQKETGVPVTMLNTGKSYNNIIDLRETNDVWQTKLEPGKFV